MKYLLSVALALFGIPALAQQPVTVGRASYAAYPPPYKASTAQHPGFNASKMLTRRIYADETDRAGNPRPIPTNDWWTDIINNQFSGALWSYPAMLSTSPDGVTVAYPSHWNENGTEVKPDSWLRVQGVRFTAAEARAVDWHDWDVVIELPSVDGDAKMTATLVHGMPFSWFEFDGVSPELVFSATPEVVDRDGCGAMVRVGTDLYGLYYPEAASVVLADGKLRLDGAGWLSVALLSSNEDYEGFKEYAPSIVRSTRVDWAYDERTSLLSTVWTVEAENLRSSGGEAPVMQGFLPHAYKHAAVSKVDYGSISYLTPRGTLKMATATDGRFEYAYRFAGMLPYYAAPRGNDCDANPYDPAVMRSLIESYADGGSFGSDTYWGGKGLTQMALNMTFAKQTGHDDLYERSRAKLRNVLVDWLTYTPGEDNKFFSYYPRWGGMLGFDVSYDSDAFNDHHFHYGYFIYAAALLCMEDAGFAANYGEILRMIAKDYANWDRDDSRFPFLRTLDPWAGHSYAGGLGDHGNDNGNGQESSSEAMQGWGAVYMLGVALGDREMRDAGIFGWLTESRATAEYWFDRDHIHPGRQHNYDYTLYQSPYNTNLTSKGIGWWTWFSGDPLWMHSIQWMPVSPCLNYLSEDLDFVKWDYETMVAGTAYSWFEPSGNEAPLADQSVGNVVLCYMERYDPEGAAAVFDEAWRRGMGIARGIDTGHISYFVIHSHLTYGDMDFEVTADCPTANAYRLPGGQISYMVYNPDAVERKVTFFRNGVMERTVTAPGGVLTVFDVPAVPTSLSITSEAGTIVPPGSRTALSAVCLDQYGATVDAGTPVWSVTGEAIVSEDGVLEIPASAAKGTKLTVGVALGAMSVETVLEINDVPRPIKAEITGIPDFVEAGSSCAFKMMTTDQYGTVACPEAEWTIIGTDGVKVEADCGEATFDRAGIYTIVAECEGARASGELVVLPELPNVAIGAKAISSSEENAGTVTSNATDGDHSTRWGSRHTDNEWLVVDLGADCRISSVSIDWEAAYAADYDVEVAADGTPDNWTLVHEERGLSHAGVVRHAAAVTGRYVRIKCLRRATSYGYSILEVEIGGVRADIAPSDMVGLEIDAPALMLEGEASAVTARAFNFAGEQTDAGDVEWYSEPEGRFEDGCFIPVTYGVHTLTARVGKVAASCDVLVEESVKLTSLDAVPAKLSLLTGDEGRVEIEGKNQFGGIYPLDDLDFAVRVLDADGREVSTDEAAFDTAAGMFRASVRGDYIIDFGGMARVEAVVRDVAEANLAAGGTARASSSQGGNVPSNVTDLNLESRWESAAADGEWIAVELAGTFIIDRVVLHWEGAYAREYAIAVSPDGEKWFTVYSTDDGQGGTESVLLPDVPASAIKLLCNRRATVWGNSLYEIEVYGKRRFDDVNPGSAPVVRDIDITPLNGAVDGMVHVDSSAGPPFTTVNLYGADGSAYASASGVGESVAFSFSGLDTGTYTIEAVAEDAFGNIGSESREVHVEYSVVGINLSLGKPAVATSVENAGLGAKNAVDGNHDTRWGSAFEDGEALTVDLGSTYTINNVRIYWNSPAFATRYTVETSTDGMAYQPVHSRESWKGGADDAAFAPIDARFVRVTGHERATPYGTSIDELEVYGTAIVSGVSAPDVSAEEVEEYYNLQGMRVSRPAPGQLVIVRRGLTTAKVVVR